MSRSVKFPVPRMAQKLTLLDNILKIPLSGHTQTSSRRHKIMFSTECFICDVKFCVGPGILYAKSHSHGINST